MSVFERFHERLRQSIVSHLGWQSLRPVQEMAAEAILNGYNAVVLAPTAGGKTEAAFFPVISEMLNRPQDGVQCIYISPIKALLNNQEERLGLYAEMVGLSRFKWHGDAKVSQKKSFIKDPSEILMITPESLEVMLISASVPAHTLFANLRFVVIDEIHALADCDRGGHLLAILERLQQYSQHDIQRIGLSATVGNFNEILNWQQGSSKRSQVVINPPKLASKKTLEVKYLDEIDMAREAAQRALYKKSLFFCDSRARAEKVAQSMQERQIQIYVHHSSVSKEEREMAETAVTSGSNVSVICTSTLELGIDIGELDLIFQAESPSTVASFLQRLGRTGRRPGTKANTTFFTTSTETMIQAIALIELARQNWVENVHLDYKSWHILVHQIMASCLQFGAVTRTKIWQTIQSAQCFRDVVQEQYHQLLNFMVQHDYLSEESGYLSMGIRAEKTFGKRNFMELYSVFSSPVAFQVKTIGGQPLGTVEWQFADAIEPGTCFLLAGVGWIVERLEFEIQTVWVTQAPAGKAPKWGNFAPKILSYQLCRTMYQVLTTDSDYPFCDAASKETLVQLREDRFFLRKSFAPIQEAGQHILWWTYAGGRINITLRYALSHLMGYEISSNNYYLKFKTEEASENKLKRLIQSMKSPDFWSEELIIAITSQLPINRLSKFQDCLPQTFQKELIANEYLDIQGTLMFLSQL